MNKDSTKDISNTDKDGSNDPDTKAKPGDADDAKPGDKSQSTGELKPTPGNQPEDSEPLAGSSDKDDLATANAKLFKSITADIYKDETLKFSDYDGRSLIFTTLEPGRYAVNGDMLQVVRGRIPTLFQFVSFHDQSLADNNRDVIGGAGPILPAGAPEFLQKSIDLIKDGTYAVKLELKPSGYPIDIETEQNTQFYKHVIVVGSQADPSTLTREVTKRMNRFFQTCRGFNMVVQDVGKNKIGEMESTNPVYRDRRNVWVGDNAHPYFGLIYHPIDWFTRRMAEIVQAAPLETGEFDAVSDGNHKVETRIGCVTDQYTAAAIRRAKRRLDENILTPQKYQSLVAAHAHPLTDIRLQESILPGFAKYYDPTSNAWNTTMIRLLLDVGLRNGEILKFVEDLVNTKTFSVTSSAGFFATIAAATQDNYTAITSIFPAIGVITPETFCRMLVMEQFAWAYDINFSTGTGIDFDSQLMELLSMLLTFVFFPKTVQAGSATYGYRMMILLQSMDGVGFNLLVRNHGAICQIKPGGNFMTVNQTLRPITPDEAHSGQIFSIFRPEVTNDNRLPAYIRNIARMFNETLQPRTLTRKQRAGLPYTRDDFRAYSSWNVDIMVGDQRRTNMNVGKVIGAIDNVRQIMRSLQSSQAPDRSMTAARRGIFNQLLTHFDMIARTSASLFFTMEFISETLQNSYLFVHEGYEPRHPMLRPQWMGMGPYFGSPDISASRSFRPNVLLDARVGAGVLITVSGGTQRPRITTENLKGSYTYEEENLRREVLPLPSELLAGRGLTLARDSFRFSEAMNILQFISNRLNNNDPILSFTAQVAGYLQMRTFSEVIDALSGVYQVNLRGVLGDLRLGSNIGDFRTEDMMMALVNRIDDMPETVQNTAFGQRIVWTDPLSQDNIRMAADLMLSDSSPAVYSSTGIVVCYLADAIISPRTRAPVPRLRINYTTKTLQRVGDSRVTGVAFFFDPDTDREVIIKDPLDRRLDGVRLTVETFGEIAPEHIHFLQKSIFHGRLSIEATRQQFSYEVKYHTNNTESVYTDADAMSLIKTMLSARTGEYLHLQLPDTTYAVKINRFNSSLLAQRGFLFTIEEVNTNEVINGIYDLAAPTAEFQINDGDQFGIGDEGNYMPISQLPKLSAVANMNNFINVYTQKVEFSGLPTLACRAPAFI